MSIEACTFDIGNVECTVILDDVIWQDTPLTRLVGDALRSALVGMETPAGTLAVKFTQDDAMAELNAQFRNKSGPTDVLSFPGTHDTPEAPFHIGDIAITHGVAYLDAQQMGKSFENHLVHLIIHGFLHCLGYDHDTDSAAHEMETIEITALNRLDISNPYV